MTNVYFVEQVQHNKTTNQWTKGVVVKADENADNEAAALQSYHAYLGAYGYGNNPDIDYVYCRIHAADNIREPIEEWWEAPNEESL
jgi:hypothetical protein